MSEITPAPEDPKDPEDQKQQLDEGEEDEEEEPSATATPASPMSRKTKISEAHAALVVEDGQRKRTRVGSTSEEPSGAQSTATVPETDSKEESAVSAPAPAPAPSFDASATGSATGAAATPASDNNKDILHPCLRLADPSFVMIPVPKVFNTPSTVNQGGFQIECAVLKSASGHIIGRGGAKIKAIRETSGAGVKMLDHVGMATFRSIVITGTFEQCRAAYGAIADQVNDTSIAANVPAVEGQHTLTLLVPNNKVGGLIGQKGAVINEIRAKSGANVALAKPDDMHVGSMDRVVTITGAFTQVWCFFQCHICLQRCLSLRLRLITPFVLLCAGPNCMGSGVRNACIHCSDEGEHSNPTRCRPRGVHEWTNTTCRSGSRCDHNDTQRNFDQRSSRHHHRTRWLSH